MDELKYGSINIVLTSPANWMTEWIYPPLIKVSLQPDEMIKNAFLDPLGLEKRLSIGPDSLVSISINDNTRPVPNNLFIPPLIRYLENFGVLKRNIRFFIANGTHIPMKVENYNSILSENLLQDHPIHSHDCDNKQNLHYCGLTSRGTPVYVNKLFFEADIKIVTGNIEPHHFMGFSGGVKSGSIGLAGRETISANHSLILDPNAKSGIYELNPMRQDVEEIGELMKIDLAFNVILSPDRTFSAAFFGDPKLVMLKGISISRQLCMVPVNKKFDLVIVSVGGYPKDINLYQAQKAITNAATICRENGTIILIAECRDGIGCDPYFEFMQGVKTFNDALIKYSKTGFALGRHKAALFAKIGIDHSILLVSSINSDIVKSLLLDPCDTLNDAVNRAQIGSGEINHVAIIPYGSTTLPYHEMETISL